MGDHVITGLVTVATAIVGIAIVAVLVSKQAQTPQLVQNIAEGFGRDISAAVSPLQGFTGSGAANYASIS